MRLEKFLGWVGVIVGGVLIWKAYQKVMEFTKEDAPDEKKKIIVLGSGFGALSMVHALDTDKFDVTIVSPRDSFVYTPLLASCLVGEVDIQSVTEPLELFGKRTNSNFKYLEAHAEDVDFEAKKIKCKPVQSCAGNFEINYDLLVIAVGGYQNTHNIKGVSENCYFFNSLNDCRRLRNKILDAFEISSLPGSTDELKQQKLHFVVVGGGPIARKTAELIQEFVKEQVTTIFPNLQSYVKVSLVEMNDHIHNFYDHAISNYFKTSSKGKYNVISHPIIDVEPNNIIFKDSSGDSYSVPYGTCIWSTGTIAHPLAKKIAEKLPQQNNTHAIVVDPRLRVLGTEDVFALGDCATVDQKSFITWAHQQGKFENNVINIEEWVALIAEMSKRFPALKEITSRTEQMFQDFIADGVLTRDELDQILTRLDQELTSFPSTASTAVQQGHYLAQQLNSDSYTNLDQNANNKFRYKHIGGFEYVGNEQGLVPRGSRGKLIMKGSGAWWMWTNVYYSYLVGMKMRLGVTTNRLITLIFGREPTRY